MTSSGGTRMFPRVALPCPSEAGLPSAWHAVDPPPEGDLATLAKACAVVRTLWQFGSVGPIRPTVLLATW